MIFCASRTQDTRGVQPGRTCASMVTSSSCMCHVWPTSSHLDSPCGWDRCKGSSEPSSQPRPSRPTLWQAHNCMCGITHRRWCKAKSPMQGLDVRLVECVNKFKQSIMCADSACVWRGWTSILDNMHNNHVFDCSRHQRRLIIMYPIVVGTGSGDKPGQITVIMSKCSSYKL